MNDDYDEVEFSQEEAEEAYFSSQLMPLLNGKIKNKIDTLQESLDRLQEAYSNECSENLNLKSEIDNLKKKDAGFIGDVLSKKEINLTDFIISLNLEESNKVSSSMNEPPAWFNLYCRYYSNKETILKLFDFMGIKYPKWLKTLIMPYEYKEDLIDLFFETLSNHYVCNGCIYDGNYGFWYNEWTMHNFDPQKALRKQYSELPWQLILKNPLLSTEKYFNKIISTIESKNSHAYYFFAIYQYQDLSEAQLEKLSQLAVEEALRVKPEYGSVISRLLEKTFPKDESFLEKYKNKMADNSYNIFYFGKYPKNLAKQYIVEKQCSITEKLKMASAIGLEEFSFVKELTQ